MKRKEKVRSIANKQKQQTKTRPNLEVDAKLDDALHQFRVFEQAIAVPHPRGPVLEHGLRDVVAVRVLACSSGNRTRSKSKSKSRNQQREERARRIGCVDRKGPAWRVMGMPRARAFARAIRVVWDSGISPK